MKNKNNSLWLSVAIVVVTIAVNIVTMINSGWSFGTTDAWVGFWGGYLGALVSFYAI